MRGLFALILILAFGAPVSAVEIAPHRALFEITLAGPSDVMERARGLAAIELRRACDGWRYRQRYELETVPVSGEATRSIFSLSAEESEDGRAYSFRSSTDYGGGPIEIVGRADAGEGEIWLTEPGAATLPLPKNARFIVGWIEQMLKAARSGKRSVSGPWFVGASPEEPLLVNSLILPGPDANLSATQDALTRPRGWRFISGFFTDSNDPTPTYEAEETMLENGVMTEAVYHYDGYSLRLTAERLERLPPPSC